LAGLPLLAFVIILLFRSGLQVASWLPAADVAVVAVVALVVVAPPGCYYYYMIHHCNGRFQSACRLPIPSNVATVCSARWRLFLLILYVLLSPA